MNLIQKLYRTKWDYIIAIWMWKVVKNQSQIFFLNLFTLVVLTM